MAAQADEAATEHVAHAKAMLAQVYLARFVEENIRLETLHAMDQADLADLGVTSRGDRRSILVALQNYLRSYLQLYLRSCDMAASHTITS